LNQRTKNANFGAFIFQIPNREAVTTFRPSFFKLATPANDDIKDGILSILSSRRPKEMLQRIKRGTWLKRHLFPSKK
jgi:hypothetical protein